MRREQMFAESVGCECVTIWWSMQIDTVYAIFFVPPSFWRLLTNEKTEKYKRSTLKLYLFHYYFSRIRDRKIEKFNENCYLFFLYLVADKWDSIDGNMVQVFVTYFLWIITKKTHTHINKFFLLVKKIIMKIRPVIHCDSVIFFYFHSLSPFSGVWTKMTSANIIVLFDLFQHHFFGCAMERSRKV